MGNENREIQECQSSAEAQKRADYYNTIINASGKCDDDFEGGFAIHDGMMMKSFAKWQARADELKRQGK